MSAKPAQINSDNYYLLIVRLVYLNNFARL